MADEPTPRDRDARGRARNARPRDALGRPLARTAGGQLPLADEPALPPAQALEAAQVLLDTRSPFRAHEVLEAAWKAAPEAERDLWRGLAQIAVGLTHALRGNAPGAAALLRRGADRISAYPEPAPHDLDVAGLQRQCRGLADRIDVAGLGSVAAGELQITLRVSRQAAGQD